MTHENMRGGVLRLAAAFALAAFIAAACAHPAFASENAQQNAESAASAAVSANLGEAAKDALDASGAVLEDASADDEAKAADSAAEAGADANEALEPAEGPEAAVDSEKEASFAADNAASTEADADDAADATDDQAAASGSATAQNTALTSANESNRTVADGTYIIQSYLGSYVLDVSSASTKSGANVQIYASNNTVAQQWTVTLEEDGYYSIKNIGSGKYLDVSGALAKNGQNIWQYAGNSTLAQRWLITKMSSAYKIVSALDKNFVVDVNGAAAKNGSNVQLYRSNDTGAQRFFFLYLDGIESGDALIADGVYTITSSVASKRALDVNSASFDSGANVQIYASNNTLAQRWYLTRDDEGLYTIQNVSSGKVLDVNSASKLSGANVQQYTSNDTVAQKWAIWANADGTFTIISAVTGMALDVCGGKSANGTNVDVYGPNGTAAQKWNILAASVIEDGDYTVYSMLTPTSKVLDVKNASTEAGAAIQLYTSNQTQAQKFRVTEAGEGVYTIMAIVSGLYLTNNNGSVVQSASTGADAQLWKIQAVRGGLQLVSATGANAVMCIAGGKTASGTLVKAGTPATDNAGLFRLCATNLISNGYYVIKGASGMVLDIAAGSFVSGSNVQQYTANDSAAQVFYVENLGNNYVTIKNSKSFKVLDVANGSTKSGANVQQYASNGTKAQRWLVDIDAEGNFVFYAAADTTKALSVASDSTAQGANIVIRTYANTTGQKWRLTSTTSHSISGDRTLDADIAACWDRIGESGDKLKRAFNYVVNNYRYISGSKMPTGNWSVPFAKEMYNNGGGNCYRFAALYCWLAKSLGYNANVVSGYVLSSSGYKAPHGWVEIHINGTTYVCDPDLQYESPSRNWYMNTYANAPTAYHFW